MEQRICRLSESLVRILNKYSRNEKKARQYGVPELLYPSEIHMVMHIGDNPDAHLSELARIAGVTRGAVSQSVAKLEKKGLVYKIDDAENPLKTLPILTNKGKVAYYAHAQHHEELDRELITFVKQLSDTEFALIESFLQQVEKMTDRLE